jgi:hypothetical protein
LNLLLLLAVVVAVVDMAVEAVLVVIGLLLLEKLLGAELILKLH